MPFLEGMYPDSILTTSRSKFYGFMLTLHGGAGPLRVATLPIMFIGLPLNACFLHLTGLTGYQVTTKYII